MFQGSTFFGLGGFMNSTVAIEMLLTGLRAKGMHLLLEWQRAAAEAGCSW
jgi:hypothetical protein